ncbi:hypothetical protein CROQUDRAFT_48493, partial [Cronartium quercuum f. sp. fusiforme G11]
WEETGSAGICDLRNSKNNHWTILPAVTEEGLMEAMETKGSVSHVEVEIFLERELAIMTPYLGEYSVLVLNNAKVHHGDLIAKLCYEAGLLSVYLLQCSPDLNPIEKASDITRK